MKKLTVIGIVFTFLIGIAQWQQKHIVAAKAAPVASPAQLAQCPNNPVLSVSAGNQGTWTVPSGGFYLVKITAKGAKGGNANTYTGGNGASMIGEFVMASGQVLEAIAGNAGADSSFNGAGGGGGTGVRIGSTVLIIAGGGGGASATATNSSNGGGGGTGSSGGNGADNTGGSGGSNGNGGGFGFTDAGGGGGSNSNGGGTYGGGSGFGGGGGTCQNCSSGGIGFGGGGGTVPSAGHGGGGGGGFSGGGGGGYGGGGGGGSINIGNNQINTAGNNNGGGQVIIECLGGCATVVTNTDDNGPGSLRQTIAEACPNATITFDTDGVFATGQTITLTSGELVIDKSLTIDGPGASQLTISGNNASRVFYISFGDFDVTLAGLTIANGRAIGQQHEYGGGILINSIGTVNVTSSILSGNSAVGGDLTSFPLAGAAFGGGIANMDVGTVNVTSSTLSGNSATGGNQGTGSLPDGTGNGGGIANMDEGTMNVISSTLSGNSAVGVNARSHGGGIYNGSSGTVNVTSSTLSSNSSVGIRGFGGGIYIGGTLTVTNSTVSGNTATHIAGGIYGGGAVITVTNGTITGNRADSDGNAVGVGGGLWGGTGTLYNTIVAGNFRGTGTSPDDIGTAIATASNTLIGDAATSGGITNGVNGNQVGNSGVDTIDISTVLNTTLANNGGPTKTHALVCGSPAIDAGSNALALDASNIALTTDQRGTGFPRTLDGNGEGTPVVDIGAFEAVFNDAPTITGSTIARQAGSLASSSQIATVNDTESGPGGVTVTVTSANPSNGITVSNIINSNGVVTANVVADCTAINASFTLTVTDGNCATTATLNVTVGANAAPTLGTYSNTSVSPGSSTTVTPTTAPADNGSISSISVSAPLFSGTLSVNAAGVVSIGNAGPAGNHVVTVTLTDNCDVQIVRTFDLSVTTQFNFVGFFQPVDNLPTVNSVNAGSSIPVKFSLNGFHGMGIFASGFPGSQATPCSGGTPDPIEETATAGSSSLSYDATTDRYTYVWKTERSWRGTCRKLVLKFTDGTMKEAFFQLR